MEGKKQLFSIIEPSKNLKVSIVNKIKKEESKRLIYKIGLSTSLSLVSIFSIVFLIINIVKDYYQSGLSEYISLLFSDGVLLASYWQSYMMSVIEALPIFAITLVLASLWIFVLSLNSVLSNFKNTKKIFYQFS